MITQKVCLSKDVEDFEKIFDEMLLDMIKSCIAIEEYKRNMPYFLKADQEVLNRKISIIEKACYPKSWEDIEILLSCTDDWELFNENKRTD